MNSQNNKVGCDTQEIKQSIADSYNSTTGMKLKQNDKIKGSSLPIIGYEYEYVKQKDLYLNIRQTLNSYLISSVSSNIPASSWPAGSEYSPEKIEIKTGSIEDITNKSRDRCLKFICKLEKLMKLYPDKSLKIMRELGIWGLPPSEELLRYLSTYIDENKINMIIDYGAGVGLWALVINQYFDNSALNVIAYDIHDALENVYVKKNNPYYQIMTPSTLDLQKLYLDDKNKIMLFLIWPQYNSRMAELAIENFKGNHILFYGHKNYTANDDFFKILSEKWKEVKTFLPLTKLKDEDGTLEDKIIIYRRVL